MRGILLAFSFLGIVAADYNFKLCAPKTIPDNTCLALQRGGQVSCHPVEDSSECAISLITGAADFGVFTSEELLLAYQFYQTGLQVITEVRHEDRAQDEFEFQTVAVVPSNLSVGMDPFEGLKNGGFCHPGFSDAQVWNDYVLKYFEKRVYGSTCSNDLSVAENEGENLRSFFGKACRPGGWVVEGGTDEILKENYGELCALCDGPDTCSYKNTNNHGHDGALDCLTSGRGKVAYVALSFVQQYFALNHESKGNVIDYQFLCPDGGFQPLATKNPCSWIHQPWPVIVAKEDRAADVLDGLGVWLTDSQAYDWTVALKEIVKKNAKVEHMKKPIPVADYLSRGGDLTVPNRSCGKDTRWCTISELENNKCKWVSQAAVLHGIEPRISCVKKNSSLGCFREIQEKRAEIIAIDSNYGSIVRQVFNLSTVLYIQTENDRNSVIVAVVREGRENVITSFSDLRKRTACFPEYGGIAWLSFVKAARENKVISDSCDYPGIVSEFLSGACAPGVSETNHWKSAEDFSEASEGISVLCSLCPPEKNNRTCSANDENPFYGDSGALECLERTGDIAFVEAKNLNEDIRSGNIEPSNYRVLCKNGSLAQYTGFIVDEHCALSVTIDSEVVSRKSESSVDFEDMTEVLLKIEKWLGYRANSLRPIHVYGPFNGTRDLLFKDSASGLEGSSSTVKSVLAYKELLSHVDACSKAPTAAASALTFSIFLLSTSLHIFVH
ncbi:transferrin-like [Orussus abietinus]|uniref:transferrin-like n=1 Tax=Orussus abietinus TaxID=222816 RepID=UPI000625A96A|nr:transferrin-like [Orussus abietinus]